MLLLENFSTEENLSYQPIFYRLQIQEDKEKLLEQLKTNPQIHDQISTQLDDLVKSKNPTIKKPGREKLDELKSQHLGGTPEQEYGVWIYYPWSNKLIHTLDEEEFIEVRTNRNRYKITREEQQLLNTKKIGIVGLSVGQSIALTLAMERTCGELRLADYDTAELSNLNRLRTGIQNLGLNKTIIAAREIAEIDPFLKVSIFNDGLHKGNMDSFFTEGGNLDLFVEVCDGLDIKIESRFKARELKIPVIMDTNDRGMLDVERFDLEPERPILHGLADGLDPENIKGLTNEEKIPFVLKMIGAESISTRLKASMLEVEQSINTWPQLASSVVLGGALTTDVSRRLLLDQFHDSGRYYIDLEEIVGNKQKTPKPDTADWDGPAELNLADLAAISETYPAAQKSIALSAPQLEQIVKAAAQAPSGGNAQPWKFLYRNNLLYIFHDLHFSYSLLDYKNLGTYVGFGAMLENISIIANQLDLEVTEDIFPLKDDPRLIAVLSFDPLKSTADLLHLAPIIGTRVTNRTAAERTLLATDDKEALINIGSSIPQAKLQLFEKEEDLVEFAEILTGVERLRFLHPRGHYDTFIKELRFTKEETERTGDGMDVSTLNMKPSEIAALQIAKDADAIHFLHQMEKGQGFKKISRAGVLQSSCIGLVSMEGHSDSNFLTGGRAVERIWLEANYRDISFQPISQIVFLNELFLGAADSAYNPYEKQEMKTLNERFKKITGLEDSRQAIFVFRLALAEAPATRSLRRPLNKQLFY